MSIEQRVQEITADQIGNLSAREKMIADRAARRAEIILVHNLLNNYYELTTEIWRNRMREKLEFLVDLYCEEYGKST